MNFSSGRLKLQPLNPKKAVGHAKPQRTPGKLDGYQQQCRHRSGEPSIEVALLDFFAPLRE
jgi:hypothetical protein